MSPAQYFGDRANEVELDARNAGARRPERGASNVGGKRVATGRAGGGRADLTSIQLRLAQQSVYSKEGNKICSKARRQGTKNPV